jgi:hypothetical protein
MSLGQPPDGLTVSVREAVQLVLLVPNLFLDSLYSVHRSTVPRDLCVERLVPDLFEGLVDFMMKSVVAAEVEQLLVGVIRCRAMLAIGSGVDITLVYDSPFVHAAPRRGIYSHTDFDPLGWGDALPVSGGDTERDVVLPLVAYEAIGSGG